MSKPKYNVKKDANHSAVVKELEKHGITVVDCSAAGNIPDILCLYQGKASFIELKVGKESRYTPNQLLWIALTDWPVRFCETAEDALAFATTHQGAITRKEKARLAAMVHKGGNKLYTPNQVREAMG